MKNSFSQKLRYRFDNFMAKGTVALVMGLFLISLFIVIVVAVVVTMFSVTQPGSEHLSFFEAFWQSLMRSLDAGTMGGDEGWSFRLVMFVVTLGGIFVISALIGVLNSGLESKLDELRKGKSLVIEKNHTVILGWSPKVFTIISELIEANANHKNGRIVILGRKDKVEMEEEIRANIHNFGTTKVICRSGNPVVMNDLKMVNLDNSRSIIVLAPEHSDPDAEVIKTVLAITNNPNRSSRRYHIVAEINDARNANVCKMVGKDEIEIVLSTDVISKITAQTCRQSGLSLVYLELLVYEGDELYFQPQPELTGKTYGEALFAYEDSSLFGLQKNDGRTLINPPMDTLIEAGDEVICISEDDDTVRLNGKQFTIHEDAFSDASEAEIRKERTLILGWNKRGFTIVQELDAYVQPGSEITIVANIPDIEKHIKEEVAHLKNNKLIIHENDTTRRDFLESLNLEFFDHIILLSYAGLMSPEDSDSTTLITLLHLRDIAERKEVDMSIVSEMLIDENRVLAEVTNADDFIVSEKVISLLLTQISEKKELSYVFSDIFQPDGSEIYLKPITDYVKTGVEVDFYNVVEAARRKGHTAIGYRLLKYERDASHAYGMTINPDKSKKIIFNETDKLVVLAED